MTIVLKFLASIWAGHGLKIGIVAAALAAYVANNAYQQHKGAAKVVQASEKEGRRRNADAKTVRQLAETPGSQDRLRRDYCRDC